MTADFTFVHAADLHLGAPFTGIDAEDPRVASALVEATYRVLDSIVELCRDRKADFLVIAGDVTHDRDPSARAQMRFQSAMENLAQSGTRVYIARGNHDPASGWNAGLTLPETVHYFSHAATERVEFERDGEVVCALYGRSYGKPAESANFARTFKRDGGDRFAVGVLHTNVGENGEYLNYAPCALGDLVDAGMDYWALGHIHKPQTLSSSPLVAYSGSPQGLNPKEDGAHGCFVVEVTSGVSRAEFVPLAMVQWDRREVDLASADDLDDARVAISAACEQSRLAADGRDVSARLVLVGRSAAHADLARPGVVADLTRDARDEQMAASPWVWVDRVEDRTASVIDVDALRGADDFPGDVVRIADAFERDPDAAETLVAEASEQIRAAAGTDADLELDPAEVVRRARDTLLDLLASEDAR